MNPRSSIGTFAAVHSAAGVSSFLVWIGDGTNASMFFIYVFPSNALRRERNGCEASRQVHAAPRTSKPVVGNCIAAKQVVDCGFPSGRKTAGSAFSALFPSRGGPLQAMSLQKQAAMV
jgi:hypothetical protein